MIKQQNARGRYSSLSFHQLWLKFMHFSSLSIIPDCAPVSAGSLSAVLVWQYKWLKILKKTCRRNSADQCYTFPEQVLYRHYMTMPIKQADRLVVPCSPSDRSHPQVVWPSLCPQCHHPNPPPPPLTQSNLQRWEITGAERPGRHWQLGRAPPVRWGHSQSQSDILICHPKNCGLFWASQRLHTRISDIVFISSASI